MKPGLTNWQKQRLLELLENERFSIMQHAQKHSISRWGQVATQEINDIIIQLELTVRDPKESILGCAE